MRAPREEALAVTRGGGCRVRSAWGGGEHGRQTERARCGGLTPHVTEGRVRWHLVRSRSGKSRARRRTVPRRITRRRAAHRHAKAHHWRAPGRRRRRPQEWARNYQPTSTVVRRRQHASRPSTRMHRRRRGLLRASPQLAGGSEGGGCCPHIRAVARQRRRTRKGPVDGRRRPRSASVHTQKAWRQTHTLDQGGRMWGASGARRTRGTRAATTTLVRRRGRGPQERKHCDPRRRGPGWGAVVNGTAVRRGSSRERADQPWHPRVGRQANEAWRRLYRLDPEIRRRD